MWGSVLGLAFLAALDPVRLGVILLLISRPRPVQNLLAYVFGSLTACIPALVIPLAVLNVIPTFRAFGQGLDTPAASSTVRHIQIGVGVLVLSIAALMTVRIWARQRAHLPTPGGGTATLVLESNTPPAISRLLGRGQDGATEGRSTIRRLRRRIHDAWENGSTWVAYVIGWIFAGPPPDVVLLVVAIIGTAGAAIGTQVVATITFIVGMLAVVEIILVSYLAAPAKTQAVLRRVQDWAGDHRRHVLAAILAVVGVSLVAGVGSL
jgi:Sap, sulfolipid-1-addressing protein